MTTVTMRRALADDVALLATLEQACAANPLSENSLRAEVAHPDRAYFLAFAGATAVGYLGVAVLVDDGHIMTVGVLPACRRQGISTALLADASDWLHARDVTQLTLEVARDNTAAQGLYQTHGFLPEGVRPKYYANAQDAIIMWKRGV